MNNYSKAGKKFLIKLWNLDGNRSKLNLWFQSFNYKLIVNNEFDILDIWLTNDLLNFMIFLNRANTNFRTYLLKKKRN